MNTDTFDGYQEWTRETAAYPERGKATTAALVYVGLGLGEAGEIQNQIKKVLRDDAGVLTETRRKAIIAEAGDLAWYLARLADELHVPLSRIIQGNMDKLEDRKQRGVIGGSGDKR